jgi:MFS family permease
MTASVVDYNAELGSDSTPATARFPRRDRHRRDHRAHVGVLRLLRLCDRFGDRVPEGVLSLSRSAQRTLASFAVFPLAFIARPVGSLFFMWLDRAYGRGFKLTVALFGLGGSTAAIAFLPGYAELGRNAVLLLALFRLGQGFALGGTWDGLASLLALNAPEGKRGWYAMIPQLGAPLGLIVASLLFAFFTASLPAEDFLSWGWRFPFLWPSRSTWWRCSRACASW